MIAYREWISNMDWLLIGLIFIQCALCAHSLSLSNQHTHKRWRIDWYQIRSANFRLNSLNFSLASYTFTSPILMRSGLMCVWFYFACVSFSLIISVSVWLSRQVSSMQITVALKLLSRFVVFDVICVGWSSDSRARSVVSSWCVLVLFLFCLFKVSLDLFKSSWICSKPLWIATFSQVVLSMRLKCYRLVVSKCSVQNYQRLSSRNRNRNSRGSSNQCVSDFLNCVSQSLWTNRLNHGSQIGSVV